MKDAIGHLPKISAGLSDPNDPLHVSAGLNEKNMRRIKASVPGGTWRDWDDKTLIADCHRKPTGVTYPSVYGRMEWGKPSPTMTTQCYGFGNGRFGHPEQDRAISLREAAILQSFPNDYRFLDPTKKLHFSQLGRMIGNAVPVVIGEIVGRTLTQHVEKYRPIKN